MNDQKTMRITPRSVQAKKTKAGKDFYQVSFEAEGIDFPLTAACFGDTVVAEIEKNINKLVTATVKVGDYNGQPSYTINEVNGVRHSGFKKGQGYVKEVVSLERRHAASVAATLLGYKDYTNAKFKADKEWEKLADAVYVWISKRPSEPLVKGGPTEQAIDDAPDYTDADYPGEV